MEESIYKTRILKVVMDEILDEVKQYFSEPKFKHEATGNVEEITEETQFEIARLKEHGNHWCVSYGMYVVWAFHMGYTATPVK